MNTNFRTFKILSVLLFNLTVSSGQFVHNLQGSLVPWTKAPDFTKDSFRFVVIGDLTGGEEEGVFAASVKKINDLAPDFVISVGDLIEGYTTDQKTIDGYWKSFNDRVAKLDAPFFYVAGNHDMSNKVLYDNWMKRYGHDYYTFKIGNSLFMILSTFEPGEEDLSAAQLGCMMKALEEHDPEFPVYVFSHAPLWYKFSKPGYSELISHLDKYNTTFFCGHIETYISRVINGKQYYQLAKTGGGIGRENLNMGDFNHILFCTAEPKSLRVANILTDGIISPDIVNDRTMKQTAFLRSQRWLSISPSFTEKEAPSQLISQIVLTNSGDYPLRIEGRLPLSDKITLEPGDISETLGPGASRTLPLTMKNPLGIAVGSLPEINIDLSAKYDQDGKIIEWEASKRWFIDNLHHCRPAGEKNEIFDCTHPAEVEESWCWSGPDDGNFDFYFTHDRTNVYCHIETKDDVLISYPGNPDKPQDRLYLFFAPDTVPSSEGSVNIDMTAGNEPAINFRGVSDKIKISGKCYSRGTSLAADVVIPKKIIRNDVFRFNAGFADLDDYINTDPSVMWWMPKWGSRNDFRRSGIFAIENDRN